jgi:hypothetical protein
MKKKWAPQRGKKIMGMPEWLRFAIVMVFVIALLVYAFH